MKTTIKTSTGKIDLGKALAALQKENPTVQVPVASPEADAKQVAALEAGITGALAEKEKEVKQKKEKIATNLAINTTVAPGQGRQPQRVIAGQMPAFLAGFLFASASARTKKPEAELQKLLMEGMAAGKMAEMLSNDAWQYQQIAPDTRTGEQWKNDAPETVFLLSKGTARAAVLAEFDANWENAFGKEENENPNPLVG